MDEMNFTRLELPDCEYCNSRRKEDEYHPGTCAQCGGKLPPLRKQYAYEWLSYAAFSDEFSSTTTVGVY